MFAEDDKAIVETSRILRHESPLINIVLLEEFTVCSTSTIKIECMKCFQSKHYNKLIIYETLKKQKRFETHNPKPI